MELAAGSLLVGTMNTALGMGEITAAIKIHKEAFVQDKRLFYGEYAEAVAHHGEAYAQAQRLHSQGYSLDSAAYKQADRHHRREFQQTKLQHKVTRDISMRSEIRGGLRDEFYQKLNRYNALMICQAVMLTCAFQQSLVDMPGNMWSGWLWVYSAMMGSAIGLIALAVWFNLLVTRRMNEYTATIMYVEMHLSEEWRKNRGVDDVLDVAMYRDYFRRWFSRHCGLFAGMSMHFFWTGVILMFMSAALGLYSRWELRNKVPNSVIPFFCVVCAITANLLGIETTEEIAHTKKKGVYGRHWVGKLSSSLRDQIGDLLRFEMITVPDSAFEQYVSNSGVEMLLAQVPILSSLSQQTRIALCKRLRIAQFKDGEYIVKEGEVGDCMYIVEEGEVVVHITRAGQGEVARLKRGQFFGELALLKDEPRTASCIAAGETTCFELGRDAFNEMVSGVVQDQRGEHLQRQSDLTEEQELDIAGDQERQSRRICSSPGALQKTTELTDVAAKTDKMLEKAWRHFQENEQRERTMKQEDWERDPWLTSVLTDVQLLHRGRTVAYADEFDDEQEDDHLESASDFQTEDNMSCRSSASRRSGLGLFPEGLAHSSSGTPGKIKLVPDQKLVEMRAHLGNYFRSTLVHVRNETGVKLHLASRKMIAGVWLARGASSKDNHAYAEPPTIIYPYSEGVFASVSRWRLMGGTEAEVVYDTRANGIGAPWFCRLRWVNLMVAGEKGRYACVEETGRELEKDPNDPKNDRIPFSVIDSHESQFGGATDQYFVTKDDDDQEDNSEVYFTVTSSAEQDVAAELHGPEGYAMPREATDLQTARETLKAGQLGKRRPDGGLGFLWQTRWFVLTKSKLCYFKSDADTRYTAQLGKIPLKQIIAVHIDKPGRPEFVIIVANSARPPYTLRAESIASAEEWVAAIQAQSPRLSGVNSASERASKSKRPVDSAATTSDKEVHSDESLRPRLPRRKLAAEQLQQQQPAPGSWANREHTSGWVPGTMIG